MAPVNGASFGLLTRKSEYLNFSNVSPSFNSKSVQIPIDFSECEKEPIHALGTVQGYGAMVVVDSSGTVVGCSRNWVGFTGVEAADAMGSDWSDLCGDWGLDDEEIPEAPDYKIQSVRIRNDPLDVCAHKHGKLTFWEFMSKGTEVTSSPERQASWQAIVAGVERSNIFKAAQSAAEVYRDSTGYDRVMIYKFHPDLSGEVIAESRDKALLPYLGLRYPATDIPSQARRLFLINPTRIIADVNSVEPELLVCDSHAPLDCSYTRLRGTSPYHIEYLQNMGVAATVANAIIVDGELWGLIVGHHNRARICGNESRLRGEQIARELAALITEKERIQSEEEAIRVARFEAEIEGGLQEVAANQIFPWLLMREKPLLDYFDASGILLAIGADTYVSSGKVLSTSDMDLLNNWLDQAGGEVAVSQSVDKDIGITADVCGVLAVRAEMQDCELSIFLFRDEHEQEVLWGGDPATPAIIDAKQRLRPRKSFDLWREKVKGQSRPWDRVECMFLTSFVSVLKRSTAPGFCRALVLDNLEQMFQVQPERSFLQQYMLSSFGDAMALAVDSADGMLQVISANLAVGRILSINPVDLEPARLKELLEEAGIPLIVLEEKEALVECWSHKMGQRLLEFTRKPAFSVRIADRTRHLSVLRFHDITLDTRLLEAMTVARDQARALLSAQKEMSHNLSHELRTPLNVIMGNAELLGMDPTPEKVEKFAANIYGAGDHLKSIVSQILEFDRAQYHAQDRANESLIDVAELCEECQGWLQTQASRNHITIKPIESSLPEGVSLLANRSQVRQIILNILGNAIKYIPANSEAGIRLQVSSAGCLQMFFWDRGHGISPEDRKRIFDPFVRLRREDQHYVEGTGLGLAVTRAIVQLHGGRIDVNSGPNLGTEFIVEFPPFRLKEAGKSCD